MAEDKLSSKVSVDKFALPSLYAEIVKVPERSRASRIVALAALGLAVEKMQEAGASIGVARTIYAPKTPTIDGERGQTRADQSEGQSHPQSESVVEELGMGDTLSSYYTSR